MKWKILYRNTKQVEKAISRMRPSTRRAFVQAVMDLEREGTHPKGWHVKELKGEYRNAMSMRLDYRHRMVYVVFHGTLTIELIEVTTREDAYQ